MAGLTKITVKGKEYPCRVTMGALVRYKKESGNDVSQMTEADIAGMILFVWCCVCAACSADDVPFGISFEKFADMLEPGDINGFFDAMPDVEKKTASK